MRGGKGGEFHRAVQKRRIRKGRALQALAGASEQTVMVLTKIGIVKGSAGLYGKMML